jgi:hypothetical protein
VAYGLKILPDGSTDSITKRVGKNAKSEEIKEARDEFEAWINEPVLMGRQWVHKAHHEDDNCQNPYGNVFAAEDTWWVQDDGDANREYFAISDDNSVGGAVYYRSEPGMEQYDSGYVTKRGWITQDWNQESALDPQVGADEPPTTTGPTDVSCNLGTAGVSLSFTSHIPDHEMLDHTSSSSEYAKWEQVFNMESNCAKHSFHTHTGSTGNVDQDTVTDGNWHDLVSDEYKVTFYNTLPWWDDHDVSIGWLWRVRY